MRRRGAIERAGRVARENATLDRASSPPTAVDSDEQQAIGIEAEVNVVSAAEGFEKEAADHQQHDGKRDLSADKNAAGDGTEGSARARG